MRRGIWRCDATMSTSSCPQVQTLSSSSIASAFRRARPRSIIRITALAPLLGLQLLACAEDPGLAKPVGDDTQNASNSTSSKLPTPMQQEVDTFLDAWHHAAAVADENVYFPSMTPDGVFVGTDKTERWTRQEFIDKYQKLFVEKQSAWTYKKQSRNVSFSPDGAVAWFDEKLLSTESKTPFHVRGSGVLLRQADGTWKIAHYVMSLPVPNEIAFDLIAQITDFEKNGASGKDSSTASGTQSSASSTSSASTGGNPSAASSSSASSSSQSASSSASN